MNRIQNQNFAEEYLREIGKFNDENKKLVDEYVRNIRKIYDDERKENLKFIGYVTAIIIFLIACLVYNFITMGYLWK